MRKRYCAYLLIWIGGTFVPFSGFAQKLVESSAAIRPAWLKYGAPQPSHSTYRYQTAEGEGSTLEQARESCLLNLSTYIKQDLRIEKNTKTEVLFRNENTDSEEKMSSVFVFNIEGEALRITVDKEDEFWEYREYPGGRRIYRCYALYAVARKTEGGRIRDLHLSAAYGGQGLWRSLLLPGWGQFYKGSPVKGSCILGGELLLAGGIILGESQRSGYVHKAGQTLNIDFRRKYADRANDWKNVRNVCIAGAAALYVYNLIDAVVAAGMKREVRQKRFTMGPRITSGQTGIVLGYCF